MEDLILKIIDFYNANRGCILPAVLAVVIVALAVQIIHLTTDFFKELKN